MKISVIIPTYNESNAIGECIASLAKQTYHDFEIIVVDDGSTDETPEKISSRVTTLHQNHLGAGAARNLGVKRASGEILVFVDADMTFDKNFLKNLVKPILSGSAKGTFSKYEYVSNWENVWARCWNINQNWEERKRHPRNYPDKQKVFRAILKKEFDRLKQGKEALLALIDEAEIAESVYNSNAIENSTLTLKETEKIIMEMEISRNISLREVFEAKNLARIFSFIKNDEKKQELTKDMILFFHKMLLENINDKISGRFRSSNEYVMVGAHIGADPSKIPSLIDELLLLYSSNNSIYFLDKIARFHLEFEAIHPFERLQRRRTKRT